MRKYSDAEILGLTEEYMLSSEHPDLRGYREQTFSRDFREKVLSFYEVHFQAGGPLASSHS